MALMDTNQVQTAFASEKDRNEMKNTEWTEGISNFSVTFYF